VRLEWVSIGLTSESAVVQEAVFSSLKKVFDRCAHSSELTISRHVSPRGGFL